MSHCERSVVEEAESTTSTQYAMSGSTPTIFRVKGGSQVKERVVFVAVMFREPTAERRPKVNPEMQTLSAHSFASFQTGIQTVV